MLSASATPVDSWSRRSGHCLATCLACSSSSNAAARSDRAKACLACSSRASYWTTQVRPDVCACADASDPTPAQTALAASRITAARSASEVTDVRLFDITKTPVQIARRVPGSKAGLMVLFLNRCCLSFGQALLAWASARADWECALTGLEATKKRF